ncbi:exo-alpha-sialidase [Streptomyces sp. NBC_01267]|uniref:exo-alpha-sialidase n=1 Tax=Streptomyces sp. NBC_01267 TaxID=2903805 RepID=UPI002E31C5B0|nr:exo-alpha-sialidase [Streptomyces sp. NBC_01267]
MALTWRAATPMRRWAVGLLGLTAVAGTSLVTTAPASAATGSQSVVVSQDCTSSRIRVVLLNPTSAATTFTVTWPGAGTWTSAVAAGDRSDLYFTKPSGTDYSFHTTTPQGLDNTTSGTLNCSTSMAAQVSTECPRNTDGSLPATHRLKLTLVNRSDAAKTFTVAWPGRSGSPWTRTVAARSSDDSLYWTVANGAAYSLHTTATGFDRTESGTATCGLGVGTPGMNTQTLFEARTSTSAGTPISGMNRRNAAGTGYESYTGTAVSVRIPSMAVTNNGTIIAMTDARVDSAADLGGASNNIQVAMRRSTDGGASWTPASTVAHTDTTTEGYGDSSLLVDRSAGPNGKVYAFINYAPAPGVGYYGSKAGSNSATDKTAMHIRYISSTDNGATWSAPVDLNPQVKSVSWAGMFASSGHGIQLSSGRLVQPIVYNESGVDHAGNIYSDDHGVTWHAGASAGTGVNENKAIQRSTGQVVQNLRSNSGGNRWYATAADTAAGTDVAGAFGTAWNSGLIDPGCNSDELSYLKPTDVSASGYPTRTAVALQSNNASTGRSELTVRVSKDDGVTWPHQVLIKSGEAGYSTTAVLGNGSIGDLYEIGATGGIVFSSFTLDWAQQS